MNQDLTKQWQEFNRQLVEQAMRQENPALYDVARKACHDCGVPWTDPRTGITYPAPRKP